jgi:phage regulator Rha-like protein
MTGEKGIKFTAVYINKFHEMENELKGGKAISAPMLPAEINQIDTKAIYAKAKISDQYLKLSRSSALSEEQRKKFASKAAQVLEEVTA